MTCSSATIVIPLKGRLDGALYVNSSEGEAVEVVLMFLGLKGAGDVDIEVLESPGTRFIEEVVSVCLLDAMLGCRSKAPARGNVRFMVLFRVFCSVRT